MSVIHEKILILLGGEKKWGKNALKLKIKQEIEKKIAI